MRVSEREVLSAIRGGARTVEAVGQACQAGTGCGSCRGGIDVLLTKERQRLARKPVPEQIAQQLALFAGRDGHSS